PRRAVAGLDRVGARVDLRLRRQGRDRPIERPADRPRSRDRGHRARVDRRGRRGHRDHRRGRELIELLPLSEDGALQYTHSGSRYLLGYAENFFGIWDRSAGETPVARFPRTDEGWNQAWTQFKSLEPYSAEVGLAPGRARSEPVPASPAPVGFGARPARPSVVNPLWWLAPILFGLLGGLVAFLVNRDRDARTARTMLIVGASITIVLTFLYYAGGPQTRQLHP